MSELAWLSLHSRFQNLKQIFLGHQVVDCGASGSGDIVSVSKALTAVGTEDLKAKVSQLLDDWSQEEAEKLMNNVAMSLGPTEKVFGVFRHGGRVGLTKATYDSPWAAELFVRALKERCLEAEFSAIYLSVNAARDVHIDSNNLSGVPNYVYPIVKPRTGGDLWIELRDGDIVRGKISEMVDRNGHPRYGCVQPLVAGRVLIFDPHRRHAVLPWKGLRIVLIGYTPGVPQNLAGPEREVSSRLGFPVPSEVDVSTPMVAVRSLSMSRVKMQNMVIPEIEDQSHRDHSLLTSDGVELFGCKGCGNCPSILVSQGECVDVDEIDQWDMFLPLEEGEPQTVPKVLIASCDGVSNCCKDGSDLHTPRTLRAY